MGRVPKLPWEAGARLSVGTTYSAHHIADPALRRAIADYLKRERAYVEAAGYELAEAAPHALVMPKRAARNILDVEPDDLAHVMKIAQKIAKAALEAFGADGITIQQFNESAGGQVVFHLHVHVIPRRAGVALKPPASEKEKPEVLAEQAERLAAVIAAG